MSADRVPTVEELLGALADERRAREAAEADASQHRRLVVALERVAKAALGTGDLKSVLRESLETLVELVHLDVAVLRLRDGDAFVSAASIGLDDEVEACLASPVEGELGALAISSVAPSDARRSDAMRRLGVRALYRLPLVAAGQLVAIAYVGALSDRELQEEDTDLLGVLARNAAAAIVQRLESEGLQQAVVSRDKTLAVVAHDLRNPISIIAMAAGTLNQRARDPSTRRALDRILRGTQRAEHLVRDLLDISAIEAGRFSVDTRRVEMAKIILAAIESQQSLAAGASVILAADVSPELPSVEVDGERLLEVLENLVGNAVKFTEAGGTVTVGAAHRDDEILLWVKDTGSGIPPEQLPHLFDRFWQAHKKDRRGTGLGLTICKAIVEAHGGRIWAESTVGVGTTMFFTVAGIAARLAAVDTTVANILLVDDRPENLLSLEAILERPEYRLVTAQSGPEALSLALRESFSVALIDVAMPGMDGLEVAVHLKALERSRDTPIIFVTAFGEDPREIHRAYSAGGADYLVKPLDAEIVRKKVAVFVELSRRRHDTSGSAKSADG